MTNRQKARQFSRMFKLNDKPIELTEGQLDIFESIIFRYHSLLEIITTTQYGKSMTVALAAIILSCIEERIVPIVAPTTDKARLIMRYYIEHLGDDIHFYSQLEKNTRLERLKQEESKERIILRNGGGIYCISAQSNSAKKSVEAAMGEGGDDVILDEAGLIADETEATIYRMIAGKKNPFYCKIGNPFYRNHFYRTYLDSGYKKIIIDYHQALAEGRYSQSFIDEAKKRPLFDVLYGCKFPDEDEVDAKGWRRILKESDIKDAMIDEKIDEGVKRLGVDIGRGRNETVFVMRNDKYAIMIEKNQDADLMSQVGRIKRIMREWDIEAENVFIDDVGVGGGVTDRLHEQEVLVNGVKEGAKAFESDKYSNVKAENYFRIVEWLRNGGKLLRNDGWFQLQEVRFKENSLSKLQIEPKEELMRRGVQSPDIADALMLTFSEGETISADDFEFI